MTSNAGSSRTMQSGLLITGSMVIIGLIDNFVPIIAAEAGIWQFHAIRSLIATPFILLLVVARGRSLRPLRPWMVAIRSILISASMLLYFGSLALMPIAEAGAGLFTSPIFVLIFSVLLFRTRVGIWRVSAVLAGFGGVLLVLKPDFTDLDVFVLFPLFAGAFYGISQLMTRHYCSQEDTFVVLAAFYIAIGIAGFAGLFVFTLWPAPDAWLQSAPFFTQGWVTPTKSLLFWTFVQSRGSLIGVAGLVRGYQMADPTYLGVFEYSFLLFAGFWGWVLWRQIPDGAALAGITAIIAAGVAITLRSRGVRTL